MEVKRIRLVVLISRDSEEKIESQVKLEKCKNYNTVREYGEIEQKKR